MAIRLAAELASKKALDEYRASASSSRLRIREILEKQRVQSLDRASPPRQTQASDRMPFGTTANRQLWVFR
jgi:hypothetical protein